MGDIEFLWAYFTSPLPLGAIGTAAAVTAALCLVLFMRLASNAMIRSLLLTGLFFLGVFVWSFIASSLVVASFIFDVCDFTGETIKGVAGASISMGLVAAAPLSAFLRVNATRLCLRRLNAERIMSGVLFERFESLCRQLNLSDIGLFKAQIPQPTSFILGEKTRFVVVSEKLLEILNDSEIDAVLAHELAHIKNRDLTLSSVISTYRYFIPYDLLIQVFGAAIHREREYLADEVSAKATGRPLALAWALVKIEEAFQMKGVGPGLWLGPRSKKILSKYPSLDERIKRLVNMVPHSLQRSDYGGLSRAASQI